MQVLIIWILFADFLLSFSLGNLVRNGDQEGYLSMARSLTDEYAISKEDFKKLVDT